MAYFQPSLFMKIAIPLQSIAIFPYLGKLLGFQHETLKNCHVYELELGDIQAQETFVSRPVFNGTDPKQRSTLSAQ